MSAPFAVLFVCTGNICRSPMAERLFTTGLTERLGAVPAEWTVSSAGTWAVDGAPMEPFAAAALAERGASARDFTARELVDEMVMEADLILCAAREHRAVAVTMSAGAAARTFTLLEFGRLCGEAAPTPGEADITARGRALVASAARQRGRLPSLLPGEDDLPDPIGAPASTFAESARTIASALAAPLDVLATPSRPRAAAPGGAAPSGDAGLFRRGH